MKSIKMFGKSVPLLAIVVISVLAVGTFAAVLTSYGTVQMSADVKQSVIIVGDQNPIVQVLEGFGGGTYGFKHSLENRAPILATVKFVTTPDRLDEFKLTVYEFGQTTLELTSKDGDWNPTETMKATLTFDTIATTFNYELTATGLVESTEYALIYYADKAPRFDDWGGDNPGKVIDTFIATAGTTSSSDSINLGMNLPSTTDWNINPGDEYKEEPDAYVHYLGGAKIWIVPVSALTSGVLPVVVWAPSTFLFEEDLIVYLDCDQVVEDSVAHMIVDAGHGVDVTTGLTIGPEETVPVLFSYTFEIDASHTYSITTEVVPLP